MIRMPYRMIPRSAVLGSFLLIMLSGSASADPYKSMDDPRMDWYKAAKFGLMIHWGLYAVPAGYWSEENGTYESWKNAEKSRLQVFPGYAEQIQKNAQIPRNEYKKLASDFDWSKWNDNDLGAIHKFMGSDAPVWAFDVPESGDYVLEILGSGHRNLSKGKKNTIHIDGKPTLSFTVRTTQAGGGAGNDWANFQPHAIGTVTLEKGRRKLAVIPEPRQKGWNMAIKQVTLTIAK